MRLLLLSLLVGALALAFACGAPTATAARIGYEIGTAAAGLADVMSNGVALAGWNGEVNAQNIYPLTTSLQFVSRLNFTGIQPQPTIQTQGYSIRFVYAIPNIVQVTMDPTQQAGILNVGIEQPLNIKFACLTNSGVRATMVSVITSFHDPPADDCQFDFYKVCEIPPISIGSYGPEGARATAVANGKAIDNFTFTATPDQTSTSFYLWLSFPTSQYYPYFNFTTLPQLTWNRFAMPSLTWELSERYILSEGVLPYTRLTITYNCDITLPSSSTEISVIIDNGYATQLQFSWMKNCSYGNGQGNVNVFQVGTDDSSNDVIQSGVATGSWVGQTGYILQQNTRQLNFYMYINGITRTGGTTLPVNITTSTFNNNQVFILNDGDTQPHTFNVTQQDVLPRSHVPITITCINGGTGSGMIHFSFGLALYRDITIKFQYTCAQPYFDVDWVLPNDELLRIISHNNQLIYNTSSSTNRHEIFPIMLNSQSPWDVQDVTFNNISYDPTVMRPQVLPVRAFMRVTRTDPIYLNVLFNCIPQLNQSITWVNVSMDYGWKQPLIIAIKKICPEPSPITTSPPTTVAPTIVPTATPTANATANATATPTSTPTPTPTPTPTQTTPTSRNSSCFSSSASWWMVILSAVIACVIIG